MADSQKVIPEKTEAKVEKAKSFKEARKRGDHIEGLSDWNKRWVGPEGYKGIVAKQLQQFKKEQQERRQEEEK